MHVLENLLLNLKRAKGFQKACLIVANEGDYEGDYEAVLATED